MDIGLKDIQINPELDFSEYADKLKNCGRIQIDNFFTKESAVKLQSLLQTHSPWYLAYNEFNNFYESSYDQIEALAPQVKAQFMSAFYKRAETNFQYVFKQFYISQAIKLGEESKLNFLHDFMNQDSFLKLMRVLAQDSTINWVDTFASSYESGHFLTEHTDTHNKHDRVLAFTIGMTEDWDPNWGGNLVFFDDDKNIKAGFNPKFNSLCVFTIPQSHAVQFISPFATKDRLSLLGWANR